MSEYIPPQPAEYSTISDPYHATAPEPTQPSAQIPSPPSPIELPATPLPPSTTNPASWRQRHPLATTLIVTLLIAQLIADFAAIITIQSQHTQLTTLHQQIAQASASLTSKNTPHQSITDNLNNWSKTYTHSADLAFDTNNSHHYNGDTSLIYRKTNLHDEVVWKLPGITTFTALTYFWVSERVSPSDLYTSSDGLQWTKARPVISTGPGGTDDWQGYLYSLTYLTNTNYVKMSWNNIGGQSWSPQVSQVTLSS